MQEIRTTLEGMKLKRTASEEERKLAEKSGEEEKKEGDQAEEEKKEGENGEPRNYMSMKGTTIIEDENKEETKVEWRVYLTYLRYVGGPLALLLVFIVMSVWIATKLAIDFYIGQWAKEEPEQQHKMLNHYLTIIWMLALGCVLGVVVRGATVFSLSLRAANRLHTEMISKVMSAPINLYFDTTPIGRILNKFSKDMDVVDMNLPFFIGGFFITLL